MSAISRTDVSMPARWWRSIDHVSLGILAALMTIGVVLVFAAGPGAAARLHIGDSFHFPVRQLAFAIPAITLLLGASTLTPLQARRLGATLFVIALIAVLGALLFGPTINGAKRWLPLGAFAFQPSELLKPGFVLVAAWMLAEGARNRTFPGAAIATGLYVVCVTLLALQPDFGQAGLLTAVFIAMYFVAGGGLLMLSAVAALAASVFVVGYFLSPHLATRIESFLNPQAGENYQVDKALEAVANGGPFGRPDAAAPIKFSLPDAHTDFIFAVAAEDFGAILCVIIIGLFAAFVIRTYIKAGGLKSVFARTAVCGLAALIGLQSIINMGVNLRSLPDKGMTLPFISYGGSSLIAASLTVGLILSLTRRQSSTRRRRDVMP